MKILACIPAFNEENIIGDVVKKTLSYVDKVIVCDDGSVDNTFNEAKIAGAEVIHHSENLGKRSCIKIPF